MWQNLFLGASFISELFEIDREEAKKVRQEGCPHCGGPLHQANYPRKPRGVKGLDDSHRISFSFCCGNPGCRKRLTPPSTRFLGQKFFFAPVILILCAVMGSLPPDEMRKLRSRYQVSKQTLYRWRSWWQNQFAESTLWKEEQGRLSPPPKPIGLPGSWLNRFAGSSIDRLKSCLKRLSPIGATPAPS